MKKEGVKKNTHSRFNPRQPLPARCQSRSILAQMKSIFQPYEKHKPYWPAWRADSLWLFLQASKQAGTRSLARLAGLLGIQTGALGSQAQAAGAWVSTFMCWILSRSRPIYDPGDKYRSTKYDAKEKKKLCLLGVCRAHLVHEKLWNTADVIAYSVWISNQISSGVRVAFINGIFFLPFVDGTGFWKPTALKHLLAMYIYFL